MEYVPRIGVSVLRKEAWDKVTGVAKYNADTTSPDMLYGAMLTSIHSHAKILSIDTSQVSKVKGVQAVITGEYYPSIGGSIIEDKPPIAKDKVRYFGEPVALVVATSKEQAMRATQFIEVNYEPLPIVNSISDAIKPDATLIHENLGLYSCAINDVYPKPHTNIINQSKIRKGMMEVGWAQSDTIIESDFYLPQSDHMAMETRNATAQISPSGMVTIHTSSQAPFAVQTILSKMYNIPEGNIIVKVPLVGGAFGGKADVQLEILAYLGSKAVGGKPVKIVNSREEDMATSPAKISVEGKLKIGANKEGIIQALECIYYTDCGAYAGTGPRMAKAIASDCTGPYSIKHVYCDSFSVYTNHVYVTSYRGFGHGALTFCMERMLDKLAGSLDMDPLELRLKNAIKPGDLTPTQDTISSSNTGDLSRCLLKLKNSINWEEGAKVQMDNGMIRAKGVSCFWKTSNSPTNATSGVTITLNKDGSMNLNCGATEFGPGMKTTMAQILAERLQIDLNKIHVVMEVDTQTSPLHWKTVASMTTFMVGNAVIKAADDLVNQLLELASIALKCPPDNLEIKDGKIYLKDSPAMYLLFSDLAHGYKYPSGESIGGQIIGRGSYIMRHLLTLDRETGKGKTGVSWTVGAQAVEIEYDPKMHTYRLLKAATAIDVGKVINPKTAKGLIMGGMSMGLGLGTREKFTHSELGILEDTSLRTYKVMRFGEQPQYIVDFIETPQIDAPFGARGLAEHGIIGIPAAFANAISLAADCDFNELPILPEEIWKRKTGEKNDTF